MGASIPNHEGKAGVKKRYDTCINKMMLTKIKTFLEFYLHTNKSDCTLNNITLEKTISTPIWSH